MPISDKKKISNSRYIAKCDSIQIRPPKERGDEIRAAAAAAGQSMQSYILQAVRERMAKEGQPLTLDDLPGADSVGGDSVKP